MRNFVLKSGYSEVGSQFTPRHRARHLNQVDVEAAVRASNWTCAGRWQQNRGLSAGCHGFIVEETDAETTAAEEVEEPGSRLASSPEDLKELTHSLAACCREGAPDRGLAPGLRRQGAPGLFP